MDEGTGDGVAVAAGVGRGVGAGFGLGVGDGVGDADSGAGVGEVRRKGAAASWAKGLAANAKNKLAPRRNFVTRFIFLAEKWRTGGIVVRGLLGSTGFSERLFLLKAGEDFPMKNGVGSRSQMALDERKRPH